MSDAAVLAPQRVTARLPTAALEYTGLPIFQLERSGGDGGAPPPGLTPPSEAELAAIHLAGSQQQHIASVNRVISKAQVPHVPASPHYRAPSSLHHDHSCLLPPLSLACSFLVFLLCCTASCPISFSQPLFFFFQRTCHSWQRWPASLTPSCSLPCALPCSTSSTCCTRTWRMGCAWRWRTRGERRARRAAEPWTPCRCDAHAAEV